MRSVVAKFIKTLNKKNFQNSKEVRDFLIEYIKKKSTPQSKHHNNYNKNLSILVNQLLSYSLLNIINNKNININDEAKKVKEVMKEKVLKLKKYIIALIKSEIADLILNKDILDEDAFYYVLIKEKDFIQSFLSEYKITKFIYDKKVFNEILEEYQSLDINALQLLYNYLSKFDSLFKLYNLFSVLFIKIKNILKDNYIKNNKYLINELNNIYSIMDANVYYINLYFNKLNSKVESLSNELNIVNIKIDKLNSEFKSLKIENDKLKHEIRLLKLKDDILEQKIQRITQHFKCPISLDKMRSPVITPYGHTYDNAYIRKWLKIKHTDPIAKRPLYQNQLYINFALKSIMDEFK